MDSSFSIKSPSGISKGRALRDPVPVREAVDTELIGDGAVAATGNGSGKGHGGKDGREQRSAARNPDPLHDHAPNDLVANPDSRAVIYRERDVRTSDEREHPDQALLRQRAYHQRAYAEPNMPALIETHADIKA